MLLSALTAKAPLSFFEPVFKALKRKIIIIEKETTISVQTRMQNHVIEIGNSFVISYKIELLKLSSTILFFRFGGGHNIAHDGHVNAFSFHESNLVRLTSVASVFINQFSSGKSCYFEFVKFFFLDQVVEMSLQ